VFGDVGPALESAERAGLAVRIASNFDGRLRQVVRGLPVLADWADRLLISSEVGVRKPHPDFYLAACASMGLAPAQVLCIGDDRENDLEGPRRAGLQGCLVDRKRKLPPELPRVANVQALVEFLAGRIPNPTPYES
jgi:putative hydrolase of the HAD superfamily